MMHDCVGIQALRAVSLVKSKPNKQQASKEMDFLMSQEWEILVFQEAILGGNYLFSAMITAR